MWVKTVKYRLFARIHANSYEFRNFVRKITNSYEKSRKMMKFFVFSICPFLLQKNGILIFVFFCTNFVVFRKNFVMFERIRNTKNYEILRIRTKNALLNGQVHLVRCHLQSKSYNLPIQSRLDWNHYTAMREIFATSASFSRGVEFYERLTRSVGHQSCV
jgi:hypothetical protein